MPRFPMRFPSYQVPGFTPEQNAVYARNLMELEESNPYVRMVRVNAQNQTTDLPRESGAVWQAASTNFPRQGMAMPTTGTSFVEIPYSGLWRVGAMITFGWESTRAIAFTEAKIERLSPTTAIISGTVLAHGLEGTTGSHFLRESLSGTVPLQKGDQIALRLHGGVDDNGVPGRFLGAEDDQNTWMELAGLGAASRFP
jgi:hypothetical protein